MNPKTLPIVWCAIAGMTLSATSQATVGTAVYVPTLYPAASCRVASGLASPPGSTLPMVSVVDQWDSFALGGFGEHPYRPAGWDVPGRVPVPADCHLQIGAGKGQPVALFAGAVAGAEKSAGVEASEKNRTVPFFGD